MKSSKEALLSIGMAFLFMPVFIFSVSTIYLGGSGGEDLYTFIGLSNYAEKYNDARKKSINDANDSTSKIDSSKKYKQLIDQLKKEIESADSELRKYRDRSLSGTLYLPQEEKKRVEAVEAIPLKKELFQKAVLERNDLAEKLYSQSEEFQKWAKENVKDACKKTNASLRKELAHIKKELENYTLSSFAERKKQERISEIEEKLQKMVNICPMLLDQRARQKYDEKLFAKDKSKWGEDPFAATQEAINQATMFTPDRKVMFNDVAGWLLSEFSFPPVLLKVFNRDLQISNLKFLERPSGEDVQYGLGFSGTIEFMGIETILTVYVVQDIYSKMQASLIVQLPNAFKISDLFPNFTQLNWLPIPSANLMISTFNLEVENFRLKKGITIGAEWPMFEGPFAYLNKLKESSSKMKGLVFEAKPINVTVYLNPANLMKTNAALTIPMKMGVDFRNISVVPSWFSKVVSRITTNEFEISIAPSGKVKNENLDEKISISREQRIKQRLAVIRSKNNWEKAKKDNYPGHMLNKLAQDYEKEEKIYKKLIEEAKLVAAEKASLEEETKAKQKDLDKKAQQFDISRVVKGKAQEKLGLPASNNPVDVNQKWKDRLGQVLNLGIAGFQMDLSASAEIILGTQPAPLITEMRGSLIPISPRHPQGFASLTVSLENMIEFKWLAIGNVAIGLDWDLALLPAATALGVPLTGIGIKGQIDLGKPGDSRASLNAMGGLSLVATGVPDFIFEVSASNIRLTDLINYSLYLSTKAGFEKASGLIDKIPTLTFEKIWGYAAAGEATILGTAIRPGVGVEIRTTLFDYPFGGKLFIGGTEKGYQLNGYAYGPRIEWKDRLILYGETPDKSPKVSFDFNPKKPLEGSFGLAGTVIIPPLALQAKTNFKWQGGTIDAEFESKWANMMVMFGITMNTKAGDINESLHEFHIRSVMETLKTKDLNDPIALAAIKILDVDVPALQRAKHILEADMYVKVVDESIKNAKAAPKNIIDQAKANAGRVKDDIEEKIKLGLGDPRAQLKQKLREIKEAELSHVPQLRYFDMQIEGLKRVIALLIEKLDEKKLKIEPIRRQLTDNAIKYSKIKSTKDGSKKIEDLNKIVNSLKFVYKQASDLLNKADLIQEPGEKVDKTIDPTAKWRGLNIRFGFSGEFSKFITEHAIPVLKQKKELALKKLDQFTNWIGKKQESGLQSTQEDIDRNRKKIEEMKAELEKMKRECSSLPLYKQPICRGKIIAHSISLKKREEVYDRYYKGKKVVIKKSADAAKATLQSRYVRGVIEKVLEFTTVALEKASQGLTIVEVLEAVGAYSYEDMKQFKLPRLIRLKVRENYTGKELIFVLGPLQFDFKSPIKTGSAIFSNIYDEAVKNIKKSAASVLQLVGGLDLGQLMSDGSEEGLIDESEVE